MISLGKEEMWRNHITGVVYKIKTINDLMVVMESLDGLSQILTGKENLDLFYEKVFETGKQRFKTQDYL